VAVAVAGKRKGITAKTPRVRREKTKRGGKPQRAQRARRKENSEEGKENRQGAKGAKRKDKAGRNHRGLSLARPRPEEQVLHFPAVGGTSVKPA
jgi:hypothetical protein